MADENKGEFLKKEQKGMKAHSATDFLLGWIQRKKFAISPYHWKQKSSTAVQVHFSSFGSMGCLGYQELASVALRYFALCEISTKKS